MREIQPCGVGILTQHASRKPIRPYTPDLPAPRSPPPFRVVFLCLLCLSLLGVAIAQHRWVVPCCAWQSKAEPARSSPGRNGGLGWLDRVVQDQERGREVEREGEGEEAEADENVRRKARERRRWTNDADDAAQSWAEQGDVGVRRLWSYGKRVSRRASSASGAGRLPRAPIHAPPVQTPQRPDHARARQRA